MKKTKLIGIMLGSIGILTSTTAISLTLVSCGSNSKSNNYNPDKSTKIIDVVPNKEMYDILNNSYQEKIKRLNANSNEGEKVQGIFEVNKNIIFITQIEYRADGSIAKFVNQYIFNDTNDVICWINSNLEIGFKKTKSLAIAKSEIYSKLGYNGN